MSSNAASPAKLIRLISRQEAAERTTAFPEMAKGLHTVINDAGVDDDDIRAEDFFGY